MSKHIHPPHEGPPQGPAYADPLRLSLPAPGKQESFITVAIVIRALRRWWKIALPVGLILASAAGAGLYYTFKPIYEASAWLQIEDRRQRIAFPSEFDSAKFVQTQIEIIRSPLVLGPVVGQPEIAQLEELREDAEAVSPLDRLARNLKIKAVGGSELYTLSWQGPRAKDASTIVNAVVDQYLELRKNEDAKRIQRVIELVQQERDREEKEVEVLQERVRELTKQVTGKDPFMAKTRDQVPNEVHQLTSLQGRLTEAEVQRVFLEAEIKAYEQSPERVEVSEQEAEKAVAELPEVRARAAQLGEQHAALRELEGKLTQTANNPLYQSRLTAFREQETAFKGLCDDLRKQAKTEIERARLAQSQNRLKGLKAELKSLQLTEGVLKKRIDEARKNTNESTVGSVELTFLQADLKREEDVFERIASRLVALKTEQRAPEPVSLLRKAEPPATSLVPTPYKRVALGASAGFLLPFVLVVLLERLLQRISESQQLREQLKVPVVREITRLPLGVRPSGKSPSRRVRDDLLLFQESIDSLRVSLVTSESFRGMRVLAVTSAANNEGKTSVAVQLAVSIARASGQKTLLIDGDMRSPDVHEVLGIAPGPGLAELLAHEITLDDGPIVSWASHLDVLQAGKLTRSPHRLLGNGDFRELIDELRQRYRYIVIDTPPVLAASESVLLNCTADGCLLCTMRDISRMDQVAETHARLVAAGARPVGVALNGVPISNYCHYYGRYYHSHDAQA